MSKLLIAGDSHGDIDFVTGMIDVAERDECFAVFIVGDFNFWERERNSDLVLSEVGFYATQHQIPVYWLDGNHEQHEWLWTNYGDEKNDEGFWVIRENLFYAPRGHAWTWGSTDFMSLGGAYSVDKDWRIDRAQGMHAKAERLAAYTYERGGHRPVAPPLSHFVDQLWSRNEELTDADVDFAKSNAFNVDVLLTHDVPFRTEIPWDRPRIDLAVPNQQKVQEVADHFSVDYVFHGHLHFPYYSGFYGRTEGKDGRVVGLACNMDHWKDAYRVFDVDETVYYNKEYQ